MSFLIRCARADDLPFLADIERSAAGAFPPERLADPDATVPLARLHTALAEKLLFVAEQDAVVIGFAVCSVEEGFLHLEEVSVHPSHGRRGIGAALVAQVASAAWARQARGVTLTTFADFPWNAPLYRRLGFLDVDADAFPHVRAHLDAEQDLGMTHRVGMVLWPP